MACPQSSDYQTVDGKLSHSRGRPRHPSCGTWTRISSLELLDSNQNIQWPLYPAHAHHKRTKQKWKQPTNKNIERKVTHFCRSHCKTVSVRMSCNFPYLVFQRWILHLFCLRKISDIVYENFSWGCGDHNAMIGSCQAENFTVGGYCWRVVICSSQIPRHNCSIPTPRKSKGN